MPAEKTEHITVTVAKSVRIPRSDDPEKTAFEFKNDGGEVSIARISDGRKCKLEDLEQAVRLLK